MSLQMSFSPDFPAPNYLGCVTVTGQDAFPFLQNIITNDLALLQTRPVLQACLLTPQGKYLHDFFVTPLHDGFALQCEGGDRTTDLARRLSLYQLRAAVTVTATPDHSPTPSPEEFRIWDTWRISQSLPNGSRDAEIGVSTLSELNLDDHAVSYTKGCYIGQELVARMHNRNLGKKHLVGVEFFDPPPPSGTEIPDVGIMRSSCDTYGLILMARDTEHHLLQQGSMPHATPFRLLGL